MWSLLEKLRPSRRLSISRALGDALALQRRGEARPDGISSFSFAIGLTVNWRARDVHPWDLDMPEERKAPRLVDQTLRDTEAAIERIFAAFPEVNTLEVNVFEREPASEQVILAGVVVRSDQAMFIDFNRHAFADARRQLSFGGTTFRSYRGWQRRAKTGR